MPRERNTQPPSEHAESHEHRRASPAGRERAVSGVDLVFPAGTVIAAQRVRGGGLYLIRSGRVQVTRRHPDLMEPLVVATLGPGQVFGDAGAPGVDWRWVTFTALQETRVVPVAAAARSELARLRRR